MIKLSVLYPYSDGVKFDVDYYLNKHIPLCEARLGAPLKRVSVDIGIHGGAPGSNPPYVAAVHLEFDSLDALAAALAPVLSELVADIPNYTDAQPVMQVAEVRLAR